MAEKKIIKKNDNSSPAWEKNSQTLPTPKIVEKPKTEEKKNK